MKKLYILIYKDKDIVWCGRDKPTKYVNNIMVPAWRDWLGNHIVGSSYTKLKRGLVTWKE